MDFTQSLHAVYKTGATLALQMMQKNKQKRKDGYAADVSTHIDVHSWLNTNDERHIRVWYVQHDPQGDICVHLFLVWTEDGV